MSITLYKKHKSLIITSLILNILSFSFLIVWFALLIISSVKKIGLENNKNDIFNLSIDWIIPFLIVSFSISWISKLILLSDLYFISKFLSRKQNLIYFLFLLLFEVPVITQIVMICISIVFLSSRFVNEKSDLLECLSNRKKLFKIIIILFICVGLCSLIAWLTSFGWLWSVMALILPVSIIFNFIFVTIFLIIAKWKVLISKNKKIIK